jgi:alginate O-acetyltransferase complex protein AlgI
VLFPTPIFALFFFCVFIISWQLKQNSWQKKLLLIIASYFFYGYWDWRFTFLLFICSCGTYLFGLLLGNQTKKSIRKASLIAALIFNLGILGFFKYYGFFISSTANLLTLYGIKVHPPLLTIILPVGISFFTFQAISYIIDVYRHTVKTSRSLIDILLYISFFPQLVAGPIVRAHTFLPQLQKREGYESVAAARPLLLIQAGLIKKMIIAHYLSTLFVDRIFAHPSAFSSIELIFGVYAYAVQIYCDFSAYSDIAIGAAGLLGFRFPDNFNHPYRASSLREFWHRWHISLSTWLRDYLYIPLGGSRKGAFRTFFALMLTMILGGLWHGAALRFLVWGFIHGIGLCIERFIFRVTSRTERSLFLRIVGTIITFHFVCFCWIFFRADSLGAAFDYIRAFGNSGVPVTLLTPFIIFLILAGIYIHFIPKRTGKILTSWLSRLPVPLQGLTCGIFMILLGTMVPEGVAPFIYYQF